MTNDEIKNQEKIDYAYLENAISNLMTGREYQLTQTKDGTRHDAVLVAGGKKYNIEVKTRDVPEQKYRDGIIQLNKYINLMSRKHKLGEDGYVITFYPTSNSYYVMNLSDLTDNLYELPYTIDYVWVDEYHHEKGKHYVCNMHFMLDENKRYQMTNNDGC